MADNKLQVFPLLLMNYLRMHMTHMQILQKLIISEAKNYSYYGITDLV